MPLPTPEHYLQILKDVEHNWALERLLHDFRTTNGNSELTKAQVSHLKALLAWGDLKARGQLALGDRFTHPNKIIAQLLSIDEKSVRTEISRSITPCIKQLLNIDPSKRIRIEAIPGWLREQGYRRSSPPIASSKLRNESRSFSLNRAKTIHNYLEKANLAGSNTKQLAFLNTKMESNLPALYGREARLKQLNHLLYSAESRFILVQGRGGVGKTRLVKQQWMESVQSGFSHSICQQSWERPPLAQLGCDIMQQSRPKIGVEYPRSGYSTPIFGQV
ncbi:MAG: ATP-binding protein [Leptolyngbyaceae bacterium]|nr:ATP-binding protein [Leptolyngbyaceae bacterium]